MRRTLSPGCAKVRARVGERQLLVELDEPEPPLDDEPDEPDDDELDEPDELSDELDDEDDDEDDDELDDEDDPAEVLLDEPRLSVL